MSSPRCRSLTRATAFSSSVKLKEDVEFRLVTAEQAGLGYKLPEFVVHPKLCVLKLP
jgi:hypothetical protein